MTVPAPTTGPYTTPNTIWLKGMRRTFELPAGVAINPGYLIIPYNNSGSLNLKPHDVAGSATGRAGKLYALEKEYLGAGIVVDTASYSSSTATAVKYAIADTVIAGTVVPGDEIYAKLPASASAIVAGDYLESNGDGTLRKAVGPLTIAAGTPSSTTTVDVTATPTQTLVNNNIATLAAKINAMSAVAIALEAVDNSAGASEVFIKVLVL